ncbi:hypothetical protein IJT93_04845 [bacterium]|nr:hypothetical protein [bacterium]
MKKFWASNWDYLAAGLIAGLCFAILFGSALVNPLYVDWTLIDGDIRHHYLGWVAYKNGSWTFPIGMTDQLFYPSEVSVVFTNSIPLAAIAGKLAAMFWKGGFQYFGLWGLVCFMLQAVLAVKIIRNYTDSKLLTLISALLFLPVPIFLSRFGDNCGGYHASQAGHWIIIYALSLFLRPYRSVDRGFYLQAALLAFLSTSVNGYFTLTCGLIMLGCAVREALVSKKRAPALKLLSVYIAAAYLSMYILGGFSSGIIYEVDRNVGLCLSNANALFNPDGWSCIYMDLPSCRGLRTDGVMYLGAGAIALACAASVLGLLSGKTRSAAKKNWALLISVLFVCAAAFILALSPKVTLGNKIIFDYSPYLTEWAESLWLVFRSTGRFMWIIVYIVMLGSVILTLSAADKHKWIAFICLSLALGLQIYEIHHRLAAIHDGYLKSPAAYEDKVLADRQFWSLIGNDSKIKHVVCIPPLRDRKGDFEIANWALSHNKSVNSLDSSREVKDEIINNNIFKMLYGVGDDKLYIFSNTKFCLRRGLNYYRIDGFLIGYSGRVPGYEPVPLAEIFNK